MQVGCRSIQEDNFFITECKKSYKKGSTNHYPLAIVYTTAGEWQLRFDITSPADGKNFSPVFNITVK
jgi:hypothetical protein